MKKRVKKIASLIVVCSIVTALFSFSAFAARESIMSTYGGYAYEAAVSISPNTGYASFTFEISRPLKTMISVRWTDDGTHYYYTNNSNQRTGTSVDVYWPWQAGQTASRADGSYYVNGIRIQNLTAFV